LAEDIVASEQETSDPLAEGFRDPPDRVTEPCLTYMARVMELRNLVNFYFNFVKSSEEIGKLILDDAKKLAGKMAFGVLQYNYSEQRPLINQIMLSRAIESFDLYLTTAMRDIFLAKPEMLKSEGSIDVSAVIEAGTYENVVWEIVNKKLHELSYKSLSELRKFIISRTGIDLFPSEAAYEMTVLASEIRNLIAHNDCIVNDVFMARIKGIDMPLELSSTGRVKIDDLWLRRASYTLDSLVFEFDERAAAKFDVRTLGRMTSFILRE
jgi:hypothetical protein